jgi:LIM domain-binding protein 2
VNEFFEDDATLTLSICLDDRLKRFSKVDSLKRFSSLSNVVLVNSGIGRVLIPRFFRTLFDGGVNEVYFLLKQTKEIFHSPTITLDCEQASMVTCFGKPAHIKVRDEHTSVDR